MKKISFRINDHSKCLLTELLPYETPIIFSNDYFFINYNTWKNGKLDKTASFFEKFLSLSKEGRFRIPFNYTINKSGQGRLTLSVMHPANQSSFVDFYREYDSLIVSLCCRSQFSLRHPASTQSNVSREKSDDNVPLRGSPVDADAEAFSPEKMYPASYFVYKKYELLYKFYDSYEFQRLEKKFNHLLKFDISKCFYHIYTHSVSWAVKDKEYSKENSTYSSFEGRFDRLMQLANYNETNGILVGPEVSRIFAEIILQRVDMDVQAKLRRNGVYEARDYSVRRYVDDYFIFATSKEFADQVLDFFRDRLEEYKLYINDKKTHYARIPAISGITIAKNAIRDLIKALAADFWQSQDAERTLRELKRGPQVARNTIQKIKTILFETDTDLNSISGMALMVVTKKSRVIERYVSERKDREIFEKAAIIFNIIIDVCSYIVSMDLRVRPTYLFSQIAIIITRTFKGADADVLESVRSKLVEEITLLISKCGTPISSVEKLNLLIALKEISQESLLDDKNLKAQFDKLIECREYITSNRTNETFDDLNYFSIVSLLYCSGSNPAFAKYVDAIAEIVLHKVQRSDLPFYKSELTHIILDTIACPHLNKEKRIDIFEAAMNKHHDAGVFDQQTIRTYFNKLSSMPWFVDWGALSIETMLKKKELRPAYEA